MKNRLIIFSLLSAFCFGNAANSLNFVEVSDNNRTVTDFGDAWKFRKSMLSQQSPDIDDSSWTSVSVPHTWNATDAQDGGGNYDRTVGWYRKTLMWNDDFSGKRIFLEALAASLQAEVFVNGTSVGTHKGGYNAFRFDVTGQLTEGKNVIAIKVDNRYADDIAPLSGDFSFIGGLYRKIFLVVANPVHVDLADYATNGLYLTTSEVSAASAKLKIRAKVVNQSTEAKTVNLKAALKNPDRFEAIPQIANPRFDVAAMAPGGDVQTVQENNVTIDAGGSYVFEKEITVSNPHLWNGLADPYRYQVDFSVAEGANALDSVSDYVGFRYFSADNTGFYLNGQLYPLRGVNRHQDWKDMGYAISENEHNIDFGMIYEIGANAVRMAHYPQDPYFHELFDKYGVVVWVEIPFVDKPGSNREAFWATTELQLKEMIRQRYNRPSIIFWGLQNEVSTGTYNDIMPAKIAEYCNFVRQEDPTGRLTAQAQAGTERPGWTTDVFGQNRYPGWYQSGTYGAYLDSERTKYVLNGVQLPIGLSEYGAGGNPAQHEIPTLSGTTVPGAPYGHNQPFHPEEYQSLVHELAIKDINARTWVWGTFVWNMFDFASDNRGEGSQPGINDKGLVTHDRKLKKDAFYIYKANWSAEPTVYIASRRFAVRETAATPVKVYSNCPETELFVNGVSQGKQQRTTANAGILEWSNVPLPNRGTGTANENTVVAKGVYNGINCSDTVVWLRQYSTNTDLSSTKLLVDNSTRKISLTEQVEASDIQQVISSANGATFVLTAGDGVTPVTSGYVAPGMKIVVTAEDGVTTAVYEFIVLHIAFQKPAIADSQENSTNTPAKAVDGNLTTRWAAPNNATASAPHWLEVDLQQDYVLNHIAVQWFNSESNNRAYKYDVLAKKDGESAYTTVVNRSANTQTDLVSDVINDAIARYVKVNITGSTSGSAYSYPSIYELQLNGWYISSAVYSINFDTKTITVPYSGSNIDISDFLKNIDFQGNETHSVESSAYYLVEGAQLLITNSDGKVTTFNIHLENTSLEAALKQTSRYFSVTSRDNSTVITLKQIGNAHLEISDIAGKKLVSRNFEKATSALLPAGLYIVNIKSDDVNSTVKHFVK
jgi:hypothetical protein